MNPKRITEYLYNNSIDLSKRLYSLVVAVSTIILVISTTVVFIAGGYQPDLLNLLGIIAVVIISGVIFWKTNRITLGSVFQVCLISFILFPISFFNGSGASGSGPIWFIYGMVLTGILLKGKLRLRILPNQLDHVHLVKLLLAGHGHVAGCHAGFVAGNEILELLNLLLLAVVGRLNLPLAHLIDLKEVVIIPGIALEVGIFHMPDHIDNAV